MQIMLDGVEDVLLRIFQFSSISNISITSESVPGTLIFQDGLMKNTLLMTYNVGTIKI